MLKSIFQVSADLAIHWQDCRDWIEFGVLPAPLIVGGRLRFRQTDLDNWAAAGCPRSAELSDNECEPLWDALVAELHDIDQFSEVRK